MPTLHHHPSHPAPAAWRAGVGEPVALDSAGPLPPRVEGIDLLCWNLAIGEGRLGELLECLRGGAFGGAGSDPRRPLVILVQEAYRADETIPPTPAGSGAHGGKPRGRRPREDIVDVARRHRLSLRYAPSMRNGAHASDRGNAVLATAALEAAEAFELPHVRQRRVAVAARLAGLPALRFVSVHLETRGRAPGSRFSLLPGRGRTVQARAVARHTHAWPEVLLGADLNSHLGRLDPALRVLLAAGFAEPERGRRWRSTTAGPLGLLLDHVLYRSASGRIRGLEAQRLDQPRAGLLRLRTFGSDHHPILARLALAAG